MNLTTEQIEALHAVANKAALAGRRHACHFAQETAAGRRRPEPSTLRSWSSLVEDPHRAVILTLAGQLERDRGPDDAEALLAEAAALIRDTGILSGVERAPDWEARAQTWALRYAELP